MSATSTPQSNNKPTVRTLKRVYTPEKLNTRLWSGLTFVLGIITCIAFVVYLLGMVEWLNRPFFGTMLTHTMVVSSSHPTTTETWPGLDAGLRFGDEILSINETPINPTTADYDPVAAQEGYENALNVLSYPDSVRVTFRRLAPPDAITTEGTAIENCAADGASASICAVTYSLAPFPAGDVLAYFVIPYISGLISLIIGLVILRYRANEPVALLATIIAFLMAIFMAGISDVGMFYNLIPLWLVAATLLSGAIITLGLIFLTPIALTYRYPIVRFIPLTASAVMMAITLWVYVTIDNPRQHGLPMQIATGTLVVGVISIILLLVFVQRPRSVSLTTRDQTNTLLIGSALTLLPIIIWIGNRILQSFNQSPVPLSFEAMMPFFITPIVAIAYAVLQYRRLDTDRIISRGITYSIMLAALAIGYFLLVMGVSLITQTAVPANDPLLIALTIFIIAALFIPVRTTLQQRIDEIYYRTRRNYQQYIEAFSQQLTTMVNYREILRAFRILLDKTIAPTNNFVFLLNSQTGDYSAYGEPETDVRFSHGSGIIHFLQGRDQAILLEKNQPWPYELQADRMRLTILKATILVGLNGKDRLNGFIVIGPPRSGVGNYSFEELRFVNNLTSQLAVAVERAQVIESLERRVRELDVLSQVGQAVNFTIEFDDLLELINAQTSRLIDAANFYIALHDPTTDQLYFAFFLEDDERYRNKENQRWPLGKDLFSEVVRTAQPLRVNDFEREMLRRNAQLDIINPHLRAWMGVPLIAGPRTLGVIAVAKLRSGDIYTDDQFKIFSDIGALAATSLDKARLFSETNMRARQLSALNEISRQLVATELDVEKLLEIITSSAVEILNAEAGSLLLVTNENNKELEFRVVIGGSGQELIGSRLAPGQGVVGRVATTGKPIISNDALHDPQHAGDVAAGFKTMSLLAVPLIAKERVIGVLEILNKKDGTIFVEEDVELVTTFAGQAAVAIENAQRFSMTDIQLTERVKELEMLERIDTELNRTLDLNQVAEITVRWAVTNCKAQAGALGIIAGSPKRLHIVAIHGYMEDEFPEGADGMNWPLDEGIIKRVMRTGQADFAPDVSIDPDYHRGLKNSLSQITIPMFSGDDINAILILETNQEPRFTLSDWAFTQRLAEHASIAIANAQLYAELARANESKSEFVSFVAHELKQPLASVKGYADLLKSGVTGQISEQQANFLNVIRTNADRMQLLINDLRDSELVAIGKLNIFASPIEFRNVVIETLRPLQQQLDEKRQTVFQDLPEDLPLIMGDQNRLIQVLTNLMTNAHKYSPPETTITIRARVVPHYIDRKHRKPMGPMLHISVTDQGIGLSEEDLARLFREKYFRSENPLAQEQPGTGLGMMITAGIIESHQGEIWVESELGKGSTFHFVIPLAGAENGVEANKTAEASAD